MAAAVTTITKVEESRDFVRYILTGIFTDTQESAASKIDVSGLRYADPALSAFELILHSIKWHVGDADAAVTLLWDATTDQTIIVLPGEGELYGLAKRPNTAATGFTGDVLLTTTNMSSGTGYQIDVTFRKGAGFLKNPAAVSAAIVAGTLFVTGDPIAVNVTFTDEVTVVPGTELELRILQDSQPTPDEYNTALMRAQQQAPSNVIRFDHTITDNDFGAEETVSLGAIQLASAGKITGGFADKPARLTGFTSNLSTVKINPNEILEAVFANSPAEGNTESTDDVWFENDIVTLTLTFGQPQDVVVDDGITVEVAGDTGSVEFEYVSGSGSRQLVFQATIPDASTAQGELTECDLTAGITLVGDDTIESLLSGAAPAGLADQDWSDLITVAELAINPE